MPNTAIKGDFMPYIETKTTKAIDFETKERIKEKFGKAIELIKGKSEKWLMLSFSDSLYMSFAGDSQVATAMISVDIFGKATDSEYDALTNKLTEIVSEELGISPSRIYIKYSEVFHWGWSGENF